MVKHQFILHRFNGDEIFSLKSAIFWSYRDENSFKLCFEATSARPAIQTVEDTASLKKAPQASIDVPVNEVDLDRLVGSRFSIPEGEEDGEFISRLYYFEHEPMRDNVLTVVSRSEERFHVIWTGIARDVSFYDGSKPDTRVEIDCEFTFVKNIKKME
jgi:hypothetical protein